MVEQKKSGTNLRTKIADQAHKLLAGSAILLLAVGTVVYRLLEDWSWVDSLYFSVVAVTTVGFGDFTPSADASKIFTVVYLLMGISIITTYINLRLKHTASQRLGITPAKSAKDCHRTARPREGVRPIRRSWGSGRRG